jgi:hypothetical protein
MKKSEFNVLFRKYVKDHLSPTQEERDLVSSIYESVRDVLGNANCLQIGSYPRFTAISPIHDLDVLYVIGRRESNDPDPSAVLNDLQQLLESKYMNPTQYTLEIGRQTHSITLRFLSQDKEVISVDIVPAYIDGQNEFREDKYVVPEILNKTDHMKRREMYAQLAQHHQGMTWIKSDPRGYIHVTSQIDSENSDFRKSVKFVKGWRCLWKEKDPNFKLKSFHIERIITQYFWNNRNIEIFDAVFWFFCDLPDNLEKARIFDRADTTQFIDEYVNSLTSHEKNLMIQARDRFLLKLEEFVPDSSVEDLLQPELYTRATNNFGITSEEYLFDYRIPVLIENDAPLSVHGRVIPREGGLQEFILSVAGVIDPERQIDFQITEKCPGAGYKWKVKNDSSAEEPRGEITDHRTRNNPESTKYKGKHYVECFAIKNGTCVARARQYVRIGILS